MKINVLTQFKGGVLEKGEGAVVPYFLLPECETKEQAIAILNMVGNHIAEFFSRNMTPEGDGCGFVRSAKDANGEMKVEEVVRLDDE